MSMNKKLLLTIVPVFTISIGVYLVKEIFSTQKAYQKDFDDSIQTSMTILGPALMSNIYNLEQFAAESSIKGIFANTNIQAAYSFADDKSFFAGVTREKNEFKNIAEGPTLESFSKAFDVAKEKGFSTYNVPNTEIRRFVYALYSAPSKDKPEAFGGAFVIEASTNSLHERIIDMIQRLILGLSASLVVAVIFTYLFLQFQLVRPIVRLMQASLDIAAGKFTKLAQPKNKNSDEIAMLTSNFNFMVNKIEINLNLIRGISEASQEIVKCKTFPEIVEVYLKHAQKLFHAGKVDIWISSKGQPTEDSTSLKRISDGVILDNDSPMLKKVLASRDVINIDPSENEAKLKGLCLPLINGRGVLLGLIELYFPEDNNSYGEEEIRIANSLGISSTTAIENCWRVEEEKDKANMERDLELASAVQDSIVSKFIPINDNCDVATYYKTAGSCGGDWFGTYDVGKNKILILFGDVTGHGTPAALITAVTRGSADMLKHFITDPKREAVDINLPATALGYLNECIFGTGRQTYFMTMVAALIDFDSKKIYASSAGHTPPALITVGEVNSTVKYFYPKGGNRLGFQKDSKYEIQEFDFVPGQQVLFYTDGVIEGENQVGREYGMKKFKQSMEARGVLTPMDMIKLISEDAFKYFDGVPPKDDIAMLAIRFLTDAEKKAKLDAEASAPKAA